MALGKAPPIRGVGSQNFAGRKIFCTHHDETAGGRAPAERPAEVYRHVPQVRGRFDFAWHAGFQCRSGETFGRQRIPQKHADPKIGSGRQEHLPRVCRFLQLQGETARHAAQTEKSGVCTAVCTIKEFRSNKIIPATEMCGRDDSFILGV